MKRFAVAVVQIVLEHLRRHACRAQPVMELRFFLDDVLRAIILNQAKVTHARLAVRMACCAPLFPA